MPMPDFLILGAQKCGTTALYAALKQHPQIYMCPIKEPSFFAFEGSPLVFDGPPANIVKTTMTDAADYERLFEVATTQRVLGEASTVYMMWTCAMRTAANIHLYLPRGRLAAILRQPVERAYSAFRFCLGRGIEPLTDFAKALEEEQALRRENWHPGAHYLRNGFYYHCLKPYFEQFPREQLRTYLYEDWNLQPAQTLRDIFQFLEVEDVLKPSMLKRHNVTYVPRSRAMDSFLKYPHWFKTLVGCFLPRSLRRALVTRARAWNRVELPPLDPELRHRLTAAYREDILHLQDLIGRDLSHWLDE